MLRYTGCMAGGMLLGETAESADFYLQCVQELERGLLTYVKAMHQDGRCGTNGRHRSVCVALFEQLGWDSYEQYVAAMESRSPVRR